MSLRRQSNKGTRIFYLPLLLCLLLKVDVQFYPPVLLTILARMGIDDSETDQADRMVGIVVHTAHQLLSQRQDVVFSAQDLCLRDAARDSGKVAVLDFQRQRVALKIRNRSTSSSVTWYSSMITADFKQMS